MPSAGTATPSDSVRTDLIVSATFWGVLAGLGEGLCYWLNRSWVWSEHLRAAVVWETGLFVAIAMLVQVSGRRLHPSTGRVALFVFSSLALCDWTMTQWPGAPAPIIIAFVVLASSNLTWWAGGRFIRLQRRSLPILAAILLWCGFVMPWQARAHELREEAALGAASRNTPNIILLIEDTVRADHLSSYGYKRPTSPNLTRLAQEGVLFANAVSSSSWTLPAHASMMTGLYPHEHHAVTDFGQPHARTDSPTLLPGFRTLGEVLMAHGYRTAAFSGNTEVFTRERGFGRGFIHFADDFQNWRTDFARTFYGAKLSTILLRAHILQDKVERVRASAINRQALRWIDQGGQRPFFLVLNYFDVHDPYLPPEPYLHRYSKEKNPGEFSSRLHLNSPQLKETIDAYDGAIEYADAQLMDLVSELKKRGLESKSVLIVTSDHGESLGEHGLMHHGDSLYRELIHVPLVFWAPGRIPAGQRITAPVSLTSLPSTVLSGFVKVGADALPGSSLAQLWERPEKGGPAAAAVVSELQQLDWDKSYPNYYGPMVSITTSEWHYIMGGEFGEQLFRCCSNAPEEEDLANSVAGRGVCEGFRNELLTPTVSRNLPYGEPTRAKAALQR